MAKQRRKWTKKQLREADKLADEKFIATLREIEQNKQLEKTLAEDPTRHEPLYAAAYGDEPPPGYVIDPESGAWYRMKMTNALYDYLTRHLQDSAVTPGEMAQAAGETEENGIADDEKMGIGDATWGDFKAHMQPADTEREERIEALDPALDAIRELGDLVINTCGLSQTRTFQTLLSQLSGEVMRLMYKED